MQHQSPVRFASLAVLISLAGCKEDATTKVQAPSRVRIAIMAQETYAPRLEVTGAIAAQVLSDLSFRVSGRVIERKADVGQHVNKGDVLARIDPVSQTADLAAARASLVSSEAQLKQAQAAFDRQKALLEKGFATQRTFDQAEQALRVAVAAVETARALQGTAADALSYSDLKAGASGIVVARKLDVGEVAQAAQTVFTIAEDGPRDAIFDVTEAMVSGPAKPPRIGIALVGHPEIATSGTVRQVAPSINPGTGTVKVKIELERTPAEMTLGAPVIGSADGQSHLAFTLPWTAMSSLDGKPAVWLFDPQSRAVALRPVRIIAFKTGSFVIGEGLAAGDRVVVEGTKLLRPGQTVEPIGDAA